MWNSINDESLSNLILIINFHLPLDLPKNHINFQFKNTKNNLNLAYIGINCNFAIKYTNITIFMIQNPNLFPNNY